MDNEAVLRGRERLVSTGVRPACLFFWGHRPRKDGSVSASCFSQWYRAGFEVEGIHYAHAEQFMMAEKARLFGDAVALAAILATVDPAAAKQLGRSVAGFEPARWEAAGVAAVLRANLAKFSQNPELGHFLLSTAPRVLVEASPGDRVWGIGLAQDDPLALDPATWRGDNRLGFALMEVRAELGRGTIAT